MDSSQRNTLIVGGIAGFIAGYYFSTYTTQTDVKMSWIGMLIGAIILYAAYVIGKQNPKDHHLLVGILSFIALWSLGLAIFSMGKYTA